MTERSERPWGTYDVLLDAENYKVKTITVSPGQRLSYQRHQHRAEHWFVVAGEGIIILDGAEQKVRAGDSVDIKRAMAHRISNTGAVDLTFVEVQTGTYFGEDRHRTPRR
ncbi:phosphomannose isomerase type II C-terminal cupin domain [Nocardia cyriacigeorgica]|uniref:phosphomannose isomerase type II C-terminal cupin domain n=1 Tax=Nocardia cyriacigeorgica TaxID=135487 RepID=UPI00245705F6|nr:phosphomannose isomerase type II C-terminal cupin domain [Nocardia cyriacigeorgica]